MNATRKRLVIEMFISSFSKSERLLSVLKSSHRKHFLRFFDYAYVLVNQMGKVLVCSKKTTAILYYQKSKKRHNLQSIAAFIKLLFLSISWQKIHQTLKANKLISNARDYAAHMNNEKDYIYVWFLAGNQKSSGYKGLIELMAHLKHISLKKRLPIYIETVVPRMVPIYQRAGFKFYLKKNVGNHIVWFAKYTNHEN